MQQSIVDDYTEAFISFAMVQPKSVIDITIGCKIPINTVYRRVHEIEKTGLLAIHGSTITEGGKKYIYTSNIKTVIGDFNMESRNRIIPNNMEKAPIGNMQKKSI